MILFYQNYLSKLPEGAGVGGLGVVDVVFVVVAVVAVGLEVSSKTKNWKFDIFSSLMNKKLLIMGHNAKLFALPVAEDVNVRGAIVVAVAEEWGSKYKNCVKLVIFWYSN